MTLLEVKHYYDFLMSGKKKYPKEHDNDILFKWELRKDKSDNGPTEGNVRLLADKSNMRTWLDHFGSFENYVDFFLLDDFVIKEENGNYVPKDITALEEDKALDDAKDLKANIMRLGKLELGCLEAMLDRISRWTLRRSVRIEEILRTIKVVRATRARSLRGYGRRAAASAHALNRALRQRPSLLVSEARHAGGVPEAQFHG